MTWNVHRGKKRKRCGEVKRELATRRCFERVAGKELGLRAVGFTGGERYVQVEVRERGARSVLEIVEGKRVCIHCGRRTSGVVNYLIQPFRGKLFFI